MDKHNVWLKKKENESSIKSWDWLTVPGKMEKKYVKDKTMTSKNATLICLYKGKIHPLYDIEKKYHKASN